MDQQKTAPGALQAQMTGPINNPTAAAAQVLVKNPSAAAQAQLNNRSGNDHHPLHKKPGVGQQLISNPGVAYQHSSTPGANQAFINQPSIDQALMEDPSASHAVMKWDPTIIVRMIDHPWMRPILMTHAPDGREVDVRPLLDLVEDILNRATQHVDFLVKGTRAQTDIEEKGQQANSIAMLGALTNTIDKVACELAYNALGGSDANAAIIAIFYLLSSYDWDAKLVLSLSAFALNYGELWLLAQIYSSNKLAESMATLKQLPSIVEHIDPLKSRLDALNDLIWTMLDLTRCVVDLKLTIMTSDVELEGQPSMGTVQDPNLAESMTHVPNAVYWTVKSLVSCQTQITSVIIHEYGTLTTELWELSNLTHRLEHLHDHLRQELKFCYEYKEEKKDDEIYQILVDLFDLNTIHIDNMLVLKALIYARDDKLPLLDGATKRQVSLEVLRRKNVLLLISSLEFSSDELAILEQIYNDSRVHSGRLESQYEVVWIPIVDRSFLPLPDETRTKFENLQSTMPWYSVEDPLLIEKSVIRFIKDVWHFRAKPILVVLDPRGKVVSPNAIHMMWIWGSTAFPFTSLTEEALWREETWRLELLVDGIDPIILNWINEGKYIFLYGGDDGEWVRRFATATRSVAAAARIPLEMVYVGKSNKMEQVKKVAAIISFEKLSSAWQDQAMVWFFWTRLESMLFSKIQLGMADYNDPIMQQIKKLLSYDREGGWAMLSKGSNIVVNGHSTTVLPALGGYDEWKVNVAEKGFDLAFKEYHDKLHDVALPCCRFEFPITTRNPESMRCPECDRVMEKYTTFLCCHDEQGIPDSLF